MMEHAGSRELKLRGARGGSRKSSQERRGREEEEGNKTRSEHGESESPKLGQNDGEGSKKREGGRRGVSENTQGKGQSEGGQRIQQQQGRRNQRGVRRQQPARKLARRPWRERNEEGRRKKCPTCRKAEAGTNELTCVASWKTINRYYPKKFG